MTTRAGRAAAGSQGTDPTWYRDAIIYEVHVRSFADSDGDGVGDFRGLTQKLPYLAALGITAVWLLPFYPSPLRDDGYDIADYTAVHPQYGTLRDFETFLHEAHRRGLRVITELVLNHTSNQHPWFQRARRAPAGSRWRDFYVWSDTPDRYAEARIIFKDFETSNWAWDPVARAYYWHRFYSHQPDLNYDNPAVRRAILRVVDFWCALGVDGLRLDAVPYLYERDGTPCENLPETHAFLKDLRRYVDARYPHRMLLAEANQWPEHAAAYFGDGDECHMAFHFPLMPRLYMALKQGNISPLEWVFERTPAIPENCQWCTFLRNHDELTLEMVTPEEREYMWREYAPDPRMRLNLGIRRRLAPLLDNDQRRIRLLYSMLFSFPGTPIVYYGDEIGMGDNIELFDRNGVRTPMQWDASPNAGFSTASPSLWYAPMISTPPFDPAHVNVADQTGRSDSLYHFLKHLIILRKAHPELSSGEMRWLQTGSRSVAAVLRIEKNRWLCAVHNLLDAVQEIELCFPQAKGSFRDLIEGTLIYHADAGRLTLQPYQTVWFAGTMDQG